jgi:hypothetical protein
MYTNNPVVSAMALLLFLLAGTPCNTADQARALISGVAAILAGLRPFWRGVGIFLQVGSPVPACITKYQKVRVENVFLGVIHKRFTA